MEKTYKLQILNDYVPIMHKFLVWEMHHFFTRMNVNYSIVRLYRTRLYRNSAFIEVQLAVPPDIMLINTKDGYIKTLIFRSIYHGPLNFDITGLYCTKNYVII